MPGDWSDPFAEDEKAIEREERRREREERRRKRLGDRVQEAEAKPSARCPKRRRRLRPRPSRRRLRRRPTARPPRTGG